MANKSMTSEGYIAPKTKVGLIDYLKIAEDLDPGPSAVDRGQGPEFESVADMNAQFDHRLATIGHPEVTLPPEVLAQLQRIEDMLTKIEINTHRCLNCGSHSCEWEADLCPNA